MHTFFKNTGLCIVLACCLLFVLAGCALPGNVYLSFSWPADRDIPDLIFQCNAPNIPTDINDIGRGGYYYTARGTFTVSYNYTDDTTLRTLDITLEQKVTILGKEDSYYDFIFHRDKDPEFHEVPYCH
jgi:hypothetical protein